MYEMMSASRPTRALRDIVTVITDRVPEEFFGRFLDSRDRTLKLWIVSPWITPFENSDFTLEKIAAKVKKNRIETNIVTRPPKDQNHLDSLLTFSDCPTVSIRTLAALHAKLYVMDNMRESLALMGSANLTGGGHSNIELGLLIKGQDWGRALIGDLTTYAHEVRCISGGEYFKHFNCQVAPRTLSAMRLRLKTGVRDGQINY